MANPESKPERDTIFAPATAAGRAGVAVIRVSGPMADAALKAVTREDLPAERSAVLRTLYDPSNSNRIDVGLVLRFFSGSSYTGENVVEFQVHGGRAVTAALLDVLSHLPGLRFAEPGEFTRRAVEAGRMDLTQAEAIADLVNAETEAQRRQALSQLEGRLGERYEDWRSRLIRAAAWIEAGIDFPDEELPATVTARGDAQLAEILSEIRAHLDDGRRGEILREGLHVAIIGPPNAGKSSLINALAKRDVAIVSETAGTTRDVIEVRLDLKGYPVILADTAGLREAKDAIEAEGIRRALSRAERADLRLLVLDASVGLTKAEIPAKAEIVAWNKADLVEKRDRPGTWLSTKTGEGIDELIEQLAQHAAKNLGADEAPALTRARHRQALEVAASALGEAISSTESELKAEHVRLGLRAIGRITGRVDLDELLDVVFRDFCIGK
ncbi:MAG TPA: tRNA uridine-5-carboxymethylaminomethyl(34) synthesis GTPase MnmE [Micropepsaceae bacterium]|nr:tRNA uridine-5-carboxymethylaminomethyl(34) synthesis GTPase MnmE [Micropepsaceae bacterium]